MEAFKCDRCGAYDTHTGFVLFLPTGRVDLCRDCAKKFREEFMKPPVPAWDKVCKTCKHQNCLPNHHPCYSCSLRFPTFDNWEAMNDGKD